MTDGADEAEALENASDSLSEALEGRIGDGEEIPLPSAPRRGERQVIPRPTIAAKAVLHRVAREQKLSAAEMARWLGIDHKEVRQMRNPTHTTRLPRIAEALMATGHHIVFGVVESSQRKVAMAAPPRSGPRRPGPNVLRAHVPLPNGDHDALARLLITRHPLGAEQLNGVSLVS